MTWAKTGWAKRRPFVIDASAVSGDLAGFPVLVVRKDDADLLSARRDGRDIAFVNASDAQAPHELIDYFSGIEHEAGWVWFARPSALRFVGSNERTFVTYQKNDGAITIVQWDHDDAEWSTPFDLHAPGDTTNLFVQEDHGPASILVRSSDSRLLTFYAGHAGPDIFMRVSTSPEDATAWETEVNLDSQIGKEGYSYPSPVQFADGTIWLIFRGRNSAAATPTRWYYSESTDGGATWGAAVEFFTTDAYGYCQFAQDGDTLYFHGNPNHPRFDSSNDLLAWKYIKGTGWRTMGGSSLTLPLTSGSLSGVAVYNGAGTGGGAWLWDIAVGGDGHPRLLYARCGNTAAHVIHHARWNGGAWVDTMIVDSGGHIGSWNPDDTNYQDDWYSGGACFNHDDVTEIYVAREVSGPPHEIWRYTTDDESTWTGVAVTENSKRRNFRPIVPRNASDDLKVVWRYGVQPDYTRHLTGITCDPPHPRVNELAARVKLDISASTGCIFYVYWGKADAAAQEDREAVWSAADKIAWSGRDAYSSAVDAVSDATSNANDGAKVAQNAPYEATGNAYRGQAFNGASAIDFGALNMAGETAITVLAGVRYAGTPSGDEHTVLNSWSNTQAGIILRIDPATTPAHKIEAFVRAAGDAQIGGSASLTVSPDTWTTVGLRYDSGGLFAVKNSSTELLASYGGAMDSDSSANLFAGRYSALFPTTEFLTGAIENVLVSFEAKSDAFIAAWHDTWDDFSAFSVAGATESEPTTSPGPVVMAGIRPTASFSTTGDLFWATSGGLPSLSLSTYAPSTLASSGWTPRITAGSGASCDLYYLAVPAGSTAPTAAQIVAGVDYGAVTVLAAGSVSYTSAGTYDADSAPVTGASASTAYDQWWVAYDGTNYGTPVSGEITTESGATAVTSDQALTWNVLGSAQQDQSISWNVLGSAQQDQSISWNVLASAQSDQVLTWNLLNAVTADASLAWDIEATAGTVTADQSFTWGILNPVQADETIAWNVLNSVEATQGLAWDLRNAVAVDLTLSWDVEAPTGTATADQALTWGVLNSVTADRSVSWDIEAQGAVTADQALTWNVLNGVERDLSLAWGVANDVEADRTLAWNVLGAVQADQAISWSIIGVAYRDLTLSWNVDGDALPEPLRLKVTIQPWYSFVARISR